MNKILVLIEFEDDLEDPEATTVEITKRIRDNDIPIALRSTKIQPMMIRGLMPTEPDPRT